MAGKPKDIERMLKIEELYHTGISDGKIAKQTGWPISNVHYYRHYVLKLPAHQTKRVYLDYESKLKGYIIRGIKSSAKRRGFAFDIVPEDFEIVTHCPLLGVELSYNQFIGGCDFNGNDFATVDRIDSSKGYVKGNVWIISRLANSMKNCATPEQLKLFATNILTRI